MKHRIKNRISEKAFLLPSFLGVGLFFVVPFIVVFYYSLVEGQLGSRFVFLENFKALFENAAFLLAAKNTAVFSAVSVPLAVVLALLLAGLIESKIPGKSVFRVIFLSPAVVPIASVVLIWQVIFHYNGALNGVLGRFGIARIDWFKSEYNQLIAVALFLWKNLGYNMILFLAAFNNVPKDVLEAADIDGAGALRKFFKIKLRYLSPSILFIAILSLINSFKIFREVFLLAGSYPMEGLYMLQHFMNNTFGSLDYQKLSSAAVVMCLVMAVVIAVMFIIEKRFGKDIEQ
ncbi:MAG: sugar ABC transporter permease [Oscillospiraceae bacterium]|nr:sugar ABC transporter permease [Oscillospiraceae bacterium]